MRPCLRPRTSYLISTVLEEKTWNSLGFLILRLLVFSPHMNILPRLSTATFVFYLTWMNLRSALVSPSFLMVTNVGT